MPPPSRTTASSSPARTTAPTNLAAMAAASAPLLLASASILASLAPGDTNGVYDPCSDSRIQSGDGFTFGLAFAGSSAFFSGSAFNTCRDIDAQILSRNFG